MDYVKELKRLDELYSSNEISFKYDESYTEFNNLIDNWLKDDLNSFVQNLDIILKYTNSSNYDWLHYLELYQNKDFMKLLIQNIANFRFKDYMLSYILDASFFNELCLSSNPKIIDNFSFFSKYADDSFNLSKPSNYHNCLLFNMLTEDDKVNVLKVILKEHIKMDFFEYQMGDKCLSFIKENLISFAEDSLNLLSLSNLLDEDSKRELDNYASLNKEQLIDSIFHYGNLECNLKMIELLKLIVDDIVYNEGAKLSEIKWLEGGTTSEILVIKDKVVKFSEDKGTFNFPNNPYIIKPLLRKTFNINDDVLQVEVIERVDTDNITVDDAYELYKKLRNIGLVCLDLHSGNVGRLRKDNDIHWNGNLNPSDKLLELEPYIGTETLKAGDLVLLDADYIYTYDDFLKNDLSLSPEMNEFEERYQEELKQKNGLH